MRLAPSPAVKSRREKMEVATSAITRADTGTTNCGDWYKQQKRRQNTLRRVDGFDQDKAASKRDERSDVPAGSRLRSRLSERTARFAAPSRRTSASGSTEPLRRASARHCSLSAESSAAFLTFAAAVSDNAGQPPSSAAKLSARSRTRRPRAVRPLIAMHCGRLVSFARTFAGRSVVMLRTAGVVIRRT